VIQLREEKADLLRRIAEMELSAAELGFHGGLMRDRSNVAARTETAPRPHPTPSRFQAESHNSLETIPVKSPIPLTPLTPQADEKSSVVSFSRPPTPSGLLSPTPAGPLASISKNFATPSRQSLISKVLEELL
jgi:hypothetical protein